MAATFVYIAVLVVLAGSSLAAVTHQAPHVETIEDMLNALAQVTKSSKDELRCHCNLPVCVTTGYMCKSTMGTCFSEIVDRNDLSRSRHGCIELITSDQMQVCHNEPETAERVHKHMRPQRPLVLCCQDDLCNYGAQQVQHRLNAAVQQQHHHHHGHQQHQLHNQQQQTAGINAMRNDSSAGIELRPFMSDQTRLPTGDMSGGHDLWLKAATIAVPIAGGCILVLLVLLAIRMLRRDRENSSGAPVTGYGPQGDFQIRSVWGKTVRQLPDHGYHHVQQWNSNKDRQPMLPYRQQQIYQQRQQQHQHQQHFSPLLQHNVVYLPTVQKIMPPKRMWNKSLLAKNPVLLHHV